MHAPHVGSERDFSGSGLPPLHESWLPVEHSLYRPRHATRQRSALALAVVFFTLPLVLLLLGVRAPAIENRELTSFPSPTEGWGYFTGLSDWGTDHLPLRDSAVRAHDAISRAVFGEPPAFGTGPRTAGPVAPPANPDGDEASRKANTPEVIEGRDGWLYLGYDIAGACQPERESTEVVSALRRLRTVVESTGRTFHLVVPPNKTTMVPQYLPDSYGGSACGEQARRTFWMSTATEAGALDLRSALRAAEAHRGAPVYWPADTHWTHDGALVLTRAIAEAVQPGVTATWRVTKGEVKRHFGDLPPLLGQQVEFPVQTYDLAPDGEAVRSSNVGYDFREPMRIVQDSGAGVVSARVGMIGDSFAASATSYFAGAFSDLVLVHADTVRSAPSAVAAAFAATDVIVLEVVERHLTAGDHPLLDGDALSEFGAELARHPR